MTATGRTDDLDRLEQAYTDAALADRVEMTLRPVGGDRYRATATDGSVEFRRDDVGGRYEYRVESVTGRHPLARQHAGHLVDHDTERAAAGILRTENTYPHAFDSIAQFFDSPHAPDLLVTSTAGHHTGGQHGRHGSLGVVQARAPFIAAGAGVRARGVVPAATRTVDVAPTIAALLDLDVHPEGVGPTGTPRADARLRRQDGDPVEALLDGGRAEHVVVLLLDGCNANLLHDVVEAGEAPNIAGLVARGTAYRHGAMASLPTATLANHTTAVTGAHPGHSGVLHNAWFDRRDASSPDLLSMDQMFWAMGHLDSSMETLFGAIERSRPGAFTSATFEFADLGATFSSFALVRDGATGSALPELDDVSHLDAESAASSDTYRFMSRVDHLSVAHTVDAWDRTHGNALPTLSWCSLALTDEAGHESGPHGELARASVRDADARVGDVLAAVERASALERTAVLVIADHGMEQTDPTLDRPWGEDLAEVGVTHRNVGEGLIYLG